MALAIGLGGVSSSTSPALASQSVRAQMKSSGVATPANTRVRWGMGGILSRSDDEGRYPVLGGAFSRLLARPLARFLGIVSRNDGDIGVLAA
jgi:hypothetical protein